MGLFAHKRNKALFAHRQLTVWAAAFVLIVQMLLPFGQAVAFDVDQDIEYQIICTANGIKQIPIDQNGAPIEPVDAVSCSSCVMHVVAALLAPQVTALISIEEPVEHASFGLPVEQVQISVWRGSLRPSRAPPLFV
ncbi:MAG: hypothetical protein JKY27_01035 [Magnetovibrio sp.]|nr:hypothetical protein [Magnetovibrio sp.]